MGATFLLLTFRSTLAVGIFLSFPQMRTVLCKAPLCSAWYFCLGHLVSVLAVFSTRSSSLILLRWCLCYHYCPTLLLLSLSPQNRVHI